MAKISLERVSQGNLVLLWCANTPPDSYACYSAYHGMYHHPTGWYLSRYPLWGPFGTSWGAYLEMGTFSGLHLHTTRWCVLCTI